MSDRTSSSGVRGEHGGDRSRSAFPRLGTRLRIASALRPSPDRAAWPRAGRDRGSAMTRPALDITRLPDLAHGRSRTGPVRDQRPVYVDLLPPCNAGCPAGENIQGWMAHVKAGEHEQAWRVLTAENPFPAIHGRVCYHPCESVCNRAELDSALSIHAVERFLGDLALEQGWRFRSPPVRSGKRVLVIGAGPSGLSAAHHLARLGHEVEIRDAGPEPGGMMRYGIPAYRLPRDVMGAEVDRLAALGVRFTSSHRVEDLEAERREGAFDAVFVAVGAHLSKRVNIPAADAGHIIDALSFLHGVAAGDRPVIGRRVAVWRRQHGDGCRASRQADGRRRGADRVPAHADADAGPRGGGRGSRAGGGTDQLAPDDHGDGGLRAGYRGDGAGRDRLSAADRPLRHVGGGHRHPCSRPGHRHRPFCAPSRAWSSTATAPYACRVR